MSTPAAWVPRSYIDSRNVTTSFDSQSDAYRSQVSQDQWEPIAAQVRAAVDGSGPPIQIGSHTVGPGATPEQQADAVRILAYRAGNPVQNWSTGDILSKLASGGAKAVAGAGLIAGAMALPGLIGGGGAAAAGPGIATGGALSGVNWGNIVPSLISGGLGVLGADAQADAAGDADRLSREMFDIARQDALPRINAGNAAVGVLDDYMGLTSGTPNLSRFTASPGYQFALSEGTKAGERALSSMGLRQSGPMVKESQRFATGLASREEGAFVDRLLATAGLGTTGAAASAAAGANNASIGGNAIQNRGAARSSGYQSINDAVQGGYANRLLQQYLNRNPVVT